MKQYTAIFDRGEMIVATNVRSIYKQAMQHLRWDMHRPQFHGTILHVVIPELGFSAAGIQCESGSRTIVMDKEEAWR